MRHLTDCTRNIKMCLWINLWFRCKRTETDGEPARLVRCSLWLQLKSEWKKKSFSRWHQVHRLDIDMPYAANFSPFISLSLPFPRPFSNSRSPIQSSICGDYSVDISCGIIPSAPTAIARNTWVVCVLLILYFSPHSYRCWDILIFIKLQCISCLDKLIAPAHLHQSTE